MRRWFHLVFTVLLWLSRSLFMGKCASKQQQQHRIHSNLNRRSRHHDYLKQHLFYARAKYNGHSVDTTVGLSISEQNIYRLIQNEVRDYNGLWCIWTRKERKWPRNQNKKRKRSSNQSFLIIDVILSEWINLGWNLYRTKIWFLGCFWLKVLSSK